MPHGDFSDYASFFCLGTGLGSIFAPKQLFFSELGPIKPFFDSQYETPEASTTTTAALSRYSFS